MTEREGDRTVDRDPEQKQNKANAAEYGRIRYEANDEIKRKERLYLLPGGVKRSWAELQVNTGKEL